MLSSIVVLALPFLLFAALSPTTVESSLQVGTGIADATGEVAQVNFMGYAMLNQVGAGLHQRLRARAYYVADSTTKKHIVFVSVDFGMGSHVVKARALELLQQDNVTKNVFTFDNLCVSGTHTHSGPAGFMNHLLFQVTSLGFQHATYEAYSQAVYTAVKKAFVNSKTNGENSVIKMNVGALSNANINRSPTAYLHNPLKERERYGNNTDHEMVLLRFENEKGNGVGMLNWFSVHGTSMNNTNKLVSGDNKGYASYLFEKSMNPPNVLPGEGEFVAAFASTNLGDVSPNINGTYCMDTGLPCEPVHSTCNGKNEMCVGRGPGTDMFESTQIIGERQFEKAVEIYESASTVVNGPVDYRHTFIDMSNLTFPFVNNTSSSNDNSNNHIVHTCPAAMGYAFAAGTTDGPGMFNFVQSTTTSNPFWNAVSDLISKPTKEQINCHHPKPILLNVGEIKKPYDWAASVVPLQLFRIGDFFMINVPTEFTTMAGRRMRERLANEIQTTGLSKNPTVVIGGLSNMYGDYTTTFEEYQAQRYEGASTVFGPNELEGFIHEALRLVNDMATNSKSNTLPSPAIDLKKMINLLGEWKYDTVEIGKHFGDVTAQPSKNKYQKGETVMVSFRSANPRNNLKTDETYLTVERFDEKNNNWVVVATDGDWSTKFHWERNGKLSHSSTATITWKIGNEDVEGIYRINHFNTYKKVFSGKKIDFQGTSNSFHVI
jgi:neutral ceramidase